MKARTLRRRRGAGKVGWVCIVALSLGWTSAQLLAGPVARGVPQDQPAPEPNSEVAETTAAQALGSDEATGTVVVGTIVNMAVALAFCTDDSYLQLVKLSEELGVTIDSYGARVYESRLPKVPVPLADGGFVIRANNLAEGRYVVAFQSVRPISAKTFDGRQLKPWLRSSNRYVTIEIGRDTRQPKRIDLGEVRFPGKKRPAQVQ